MKPKFYFDLQQHIFDPNNRFNYQTNQDWLELRADRFTASNAKDLLSNGKDKDGLSKTIKKIINSRAMQNLTGWIDDSAISYSEKECITRGLVYEEEARKWYEQQTGRKIVECGFVERGKYIGCSPDGLVIDELRTVQIKIPMPANFVDAILNGWEDYVPQCHFERFVCCFKVSDLVIYSPELRTGKIIEIPADQKIDLAILLKLRTAINYRDMVYSELNNLSK